VSIFFRFLICKRSRVPGALMALRRWMVLVCLLLMVGSCRADITLNGLLGLNIPTNLNQLPVTIPSNLNITNVGSFFEQAFGTLLFGTTTNRTLGGCDAVGQHCNWNTYWWDVWYTGLWAWIVAAGVMALLLLFLLLRICCCCCICIVELFFESVFCCFKRCCSNANNACIWTVRLVILLDVGLGATGFAFATMGWIDAERCANEVVGNYSQYVGPDLQIAAAAASGTLSAVNAALATVGQLTNQSNLARVLTPYQIMTPNATQQAIFTNWTTIDDPKVATYRRAWFILFWVAIGVPLGMLAMTFFFGVLARSSACPSLLAVLGLLATALVWAAIGLTGSGISVIDDVCGQAQAMLHDPSAGYTLTELLHCTRPSDLNEFATTVAVYTSASGTAYEAACGSVRGRCADGSLSCPAIPSTCTQLKQVASLSTTITVPTSAAAGGCNDSCTAAVCAENCTGARLLDASQGLVYSTQVANLLNASMQNLLQPLVTCQYLQSTFIVQFNVQCAVLQRTSTQIIWGMFALAVASFLGSFLAIALAPWFDGTASTGKPQYREKEPTQNPLLPL